MANLRDIKKRISSVTTTKQITRTMEMVSTAKIRRALDRSKQAEPYTEALTDVMLTVAGDASCSGNDPMLHKHESVKHGLIVVIASDRGLAGGFNTTVERTAEKLAASWANDGIECEIIACGRKPATYFRDRANVIMHFEGNSSEPDFNQARMMSSHICDAYRAGELDRVELVYHHAKNRVDQELRVEHLLPLDPEMIAMAHGPRKNETDAPKRSRACSRQACTVIYLDGHLPGPDRFGGCRAGCTPQGHALRDGKRHRDHLDPYPHV